MSLGDKIRERISKMLGTRKKERETTEELYIKTGQIKRGKSPIKHLEERVTKTVPLSKIKKLYHLDFLCFRIVNDYIDSMVGLGLFLDGDKKVTKELMEWADKVNLQRVLEDIIRDIFLAGNAWLEIGYSEDFKDILTLRVLNPETMDFIREKGKNYVEIDENGNPIGYVRKESYGLNKIEWRKDRIIVGDEEIHLSPDQDGRDRISHFKLWSMSESFLGCTPLEPVYRQAIIRLNISRNVGEGAFRSEGLLITVGDENITPTNEQLDNVVEEFENIETQTIFGFKYSPRVRVERLPSPEIADRDTLLYYFADAFATGMGRPLCLLMELKGRDAAIENKQIEWEKKILALQERFGDQVKEKIFYKYLDIKGIPRKKLKRVIFRSPRSSIKMARARRLATLARRGLIRYDPELEERLREEENLPTSLVENEIKEWKKTKKRLIESKEIEIKQSKRKRKR